MVAGGVQQEGAVLVAALIAVGAQVAQHLLGGITIGLGLVGIDILLQLQQGTGYDTGGRGILGGFLTARVVHIPDGHPVAAGFMQALQIDVGHLLGMVEEPLVFGEAIDHGIAVDGPRLSTAPHRLVGIALMGDALDEVTVERVVHCHMIAAAVLAEVVFHRGFGMPHSHVI